MEDLALEDRAEHPSKPAAKDDPRFAHGWQTRVAEKLGIDQSYVSRIRSGLPVAPALPAQAVKTTAITSTSLIAFPLGLREGNMVPEKRMSNGIDIHHADRHSFLVPPARSPIECLPPPR